MRQRPARSGERFAFGQNWTEFVGNVTPQRVARAEVSLRNLLEMETLEGRRFVDIGCGSGLFSLAAARLGADVRAFDYDPQSVEAARRLRDRFDPDGAWSVERGDVLDPDFLSRVEPADLVYSWGVLHHTGDLWQACANAATLVAPGGRLAVAIYNDQGWMSHVWRQLKRLYVRLPAARPVVVAITFLLTWFPIMARDALRGRSPLRSWRNYDPVRGMNAWNDLVDWAGGYPFEVASRERVIGFFEDRGFELRKLVSVGWRLGCNEYVFDRSA